jgi:hypothetical protein
MRAPCLYLFLPRSAQLSQTASGKLLRRKYTRRTWDKYREAALRPRKGSINKRETLRRWSAYSPEDAFNGLATIGADDKIELKPITLGRNLGTEVEVVKGLTLSDRVVNSPPDSLADGDTVRIAGQQSDAASGNVGQAVNENVATAPE